MSWLGLKTAGPSEPGRRSYTTEYSRESYEVEYRRVPRVIEHRYGSPPRNHGVATVEAFRVPSSFDHDRPKEVDGLISKILTEVNRPSNGFHSSPPYKHNTPYAMGQDHGYKHGIPHSTRPDYGYENSSPHAVRHDHGYRDDSPRRIGQDHGYKHHGPLSNGKDRVIPRVIDHEYDSPPRDHRVRVVEPIHSPPSSNHNTKEIDELVSKILNESRPIKDALNNPAYKLNNPHPVRHDHSPVSNKHNNFSSTGKAHPTDPIKYHGANKNDHWNSPYGHNSPHKDHTHTPHDYGKKNSFNKNDPEKASPWNSPRKDHVPDYVKHNGLNNKDREKATPWYPANNNNSPGKDGAVNYGKYNSFQDDDFEKKSPWKSNNNYNNTPLSRQDHAPDYIKNKSFRDKDYSDKASPRYSANKPNSPKKDHFADYGKYNSHGENDSRSPSDDEDYDSDDDVVCDGDVCYKVNKGPNQNHSQGDGYEKHNSSPDRRGNTKPLLVSGGTKQPSHTVPIPLFSANRPNTVSSPPVSRPTNNIGEVMDFLKGKDNHSYLPSAPTSGHAKPQVVAPASTPFAKGVLPGTIDSREAAKRYGNLAPRSNPEDKHREVIDSNEAMVKYGGAPVPK